MALWECFGAITTGEENSASVSRPGMLLNNLQGTGQSLNNEESPSSKKSTAPRLRGPAIDGIIGMQFVPEHSTHVGFARGAITGLP